MKHILVPCDFSDTAINAFRLAVDLAGQGGGDIALLHVIELPVIFDTAIAPDLSFEEAFFKEAREGAERDFVKIRNKWAKDGPKVKLHMEYGGVTPTIDHFVRKNKIDLVVMGTRGATGVKEFLIGSNTEKIVRRSPVPVIAVKKYVRASSIRSIVFPNTLGDDQEELTMKVKELQNFFDASLHIVYVNTPAHFRSDSETRPLLKAFAKRFMLKEYTIHVFNDVSYEGGIINFTHEQGADMIVMATHGRRGINHLLNGSIAEDVVNSVDCPIWTCLAN